MSFERAVVHIGVHKTGSTAIQQTLYAHRERLSGEHGALYPELDDSGTSAPNPWLAANHGVWLYSIFSDEPEKYGPNVSRGIDTVDGARRINEQRLEALENILRSRQAQVLILSGEDLSILPAEGVRRFSTWIRDLAIDVSVVVFLRDPVSWATSRIQQEVKQRHWTLEQAYEFGFSFRKLPARLSAWVEEFGRAKIQALDFGTAQGHPQGIVGTFCAHAGLPSTFAESIDTSARYNESLSGLATLLLSELNKRRPFKLDGRPNPDRSKDDWRAFETVESARLELPDEVRKQVLSDSRVACKWIADTLGLHYSCDPSSAADAERARAHPLYELDREALGSLALTMVDLFREPRSR